MNICAYQFFDISGEDEAADWGEYGEDSETGCCCCWTRRGRLLRARDGDVEDVAAVGEDDGGGGNILAILGDSDAEDSGFGGPLPVVAYLRAWWWEASKLGGGAIIADE
jgi:hypothetical protein